MALAPPKSANTNVYFGQIMIVHAYFGQIVHANVYFGQIVNANVYFGQIVHDHAGAAGWTGGWFGGTRDNHSVVTTQLLEKEYCLGR